MSECLTDGGQARIVELEAGKQTCAPLTRYSVLKEFDNHPKGKAFCHQLAEASGLGTQPKPRGGPRFSERHSGLQSLRFFRGQIRPGNARRHT
jgi:hypothetical protein